MLPDPKTPVVIMLRTLTYNSRSGPRGRIAEAFRLGLEAAIHGLPWERDDWSEIMLRWGGMNRQLFGDHAPLGQTAEEGWYRRMVEAPNGSACQSFEKWAKRGVFERPGWADPEAPAPKPLFVGCTFPWKGEQLRVTSFSEASEAFPKGRVVCVADADPHKVRRLPPEVLATWSNLPGWGAHADPA